MQPHARPRKHQGDSGQVTDLEDCKAKSKAAWARVRALAKAREEHRQSRINNQELKSAPQAGPGGSLARLMSEWMKFCRYYLSQPPATPYPGFVATGFTAYRRKAFAQDYLQSTANRVLPCRRRIDCGILPMLLCTTA
jgi:hypothetical protein